MTKKKKGTDEIVVVSDSRREIRESDPDPDFDPEVIACMSSSLNVKIHSDTNEDDEPLTRYSPSKYGKCRGFLKELCSCCLKTTNDNGPVESEVSTLPKYTYSTVHEAVSSQAYPYSPQSTYESTNIPQKHKLVPKEPSFLKDPT